MVEVLTNAQMACLVNGDGDVGEDSKESPETQVVGFDRVVVSAKAKDLDKDQGLGKVSAVARPRTFHLPRH